ncbi:Lovastatin diketide synthase LovF 5 [Colletotrichum chlorophyti]|uniref:Lovastatin diketide synthase LovF 5 n=1 Tax=Colletotrichum chlorophyti TaxID=708187 RepID=A0A1Q8RGI7_9PEZI|nr:Lovastatin diketide synthase LovF 5 [Colletotrichum chlorophyti]
MGEPIAIIGLSARLPGDGDTPERFYESLLAGRSARTEVPLERYNANAFWHPDSQRSGATRVRHGHFLKGSIAAFDAPFFSITPTEARSIDPQQRGMLESVYKALENGTVLPSPGLVEVDADLPCCAAGIPLETVAGTQTGVYVGCFTADYNDHIAKDLDLPNKYSALGTVASMLSNRVSWFFDFRGPSVTIDTACSSSLVALNEACGSLKLRETNMVSWLSPVEGAVKHGVPHVLTPSFQAIVGGCNLILTPEMTLKLDAAGVLGPDGKSYSFDHRANGYSRGEGFGVLVLKRVSDAIRDGDVIRAVIRNSSTNQDGRSPGITQPTKAGQVALIRHVYARAGLDPSLTRYAEAHGTGTPVGDPIEASALAEIFASHRSSDEPLYVGALKSNVGHLEGAAGVAAVIKGVLTLESGVIPGNIWFEKRNPKIHDSWHLKFPTGPTVWPQLGLRRMSINSFGVGGSNAHVVMDDALHFLQLHRLTGNHRTVATPVLPSLVEAPVVNENDGVNRFHRPTDSSVHLNDYESASSDVAPRLFVLSANDQDGVTRLKKSYKEYLATKTGPNVEKSGQFQFLRDLSYTLASRRTHHAWRSFSIAGSRTRLQTALEETSKAVKAKAAPRLAYIFTGQGAQWAAMGMDLMAYRAFQESLLAADRYLNDLGCRWSLTFELSKPKTSSRIDDPEFCQPICTALQIALVDLLSSWGIHPHAIAGHSSGEVAAAYAAGAITREAAWRVAYHRGRLSAQLARSDLRPKTGMAAVGLDKAKTQASIDRINKLGGDGTLEIACMNSIDSHTVSGDAGKIDALVEMLSAEKAFARRLNVEIAYHSQYMKAMADEYLQVMGDLEQGRRQSSFEARFYSSTRGAAISLSQLRQPEYWVTNLVSPVRFTESVTEMLNGSTVKEVNGYVNGQVNGQAKANINGDADGYVKQSDVAEPITDFLEIGPHSALKGPTLTTVKKIQGSTSVDYHSVLRRQKSGLETALEAVGALFCHGHKIDLAAVNDADEAHGPRPLMLTNLPAYPFDHSKEYWIESTMSKDFRQRPVGRHELLGAPMPGFNKNNATWRNYIRLTENPWIEDHKVSGDVLYPAAGMLVMAIEASRQVADKSKVLRGFNFKDVSFKLALRVPDNAHGVESQFFLRQHRSSSLSGPSAWQEFQLWTLQEGDWREHCHGFVHTEYEADDALDFQAWNSQLILSSCDKDIVDSCMAEVPTDKLYRRFQDSGLDFGPAFQTLSNVQLGQNLSMVATVCSPSDKIKKSMPLEYVQPCLVHPVALDALVHANLAPLVSGTKSSRATRVSAESRLQGSSEVVAETTATHLTQGHAMVHLSGLVFKSIHDGEPEGALDVSKQPAFNMSWKPDPSFLTQKQASQLFELPMKKEDDPSNWMSDCEALCLAYIRRCVDTTSQGVADKLAWHHQRYLTWFQHVARHSSETPVSENMAELEAKVIDRGASEGKLIVAVGRALSDILSGQRDPLDVIFKDKLAEDVYRNGLGSKRCYTQLCNYLDALAHKNPAMEILEIGAGTGGATRPVMETLTQHGRRYKHYTFTDISASFFEHAKETFQDELSRMNFRVLNIENDPLNQDFEAGRYDLIVAANVLHATKKIDETLRNAAKLLKPGGKLLLFEITNTDILLGSFCFGVLPGWWLSEDKDRVWGPLMSAESWRNHLLASGFSGLDAVFDDFTGSPHRMSSILVSTVPPSISTIDRSRPSYILTSGASVQLKVAEGISHGIGCQGGTCEAITLRTTVDKDMTGATCVVLSEFDKPTLRDMTEEAFEGFKRVLTQCNIILWLTRGGSSSVSNPDAELVTGLARVVRSERPDVKFLTLSFEQNTTENLVIEKCLDMLQATRDGRENSFRVIGDVVNVPRLVRADYMTEHIQAQTGSLHVANMPLSEQGSRSLGLQVGTVGQIETLRFENGNLFEKPLGDREVEFKTMACGLGTADLALVLGKTRESCLGHEASGIVTRAGSASKFQVGDRVFGLSVTGAIKTHVRSTDGFLAKLPEGVAWTTAASLPVAYTTAYAVLHEFGSVRKGDIILIHNGSSRLGQAFIHLAQLEGAELYTTVDNQRERDDLESKLGVPRDHILDSRDRLIKKTLQCMTRGRGVNIVINTTDDAEFIDGIVDVVAPFGRIVSLGLESDSSSACLPRGRNIRLESFDLTACAAYDAARTQSMFQQAADIISSSWDVISQRVTATVYPFSQVHDAFRQLQEKKQSTSIVLEPHDADIVPIMPSRKPISRFDSDASYVIAGGLGGLGRSVARWMASRGARHLILLSRRGPVDDAAKELVHELESVCDNVATPACDVTDAETLRKVITELSVTLPPIRGCIQGSMVLQDNRIQDMTLAQWKSAILPKVDASWNLYNVLGDKADFFVFLSSTVGVTGSPDQANYAASGTFQDALARHLASQGINAVSIDLPIVQGVGYVAEKPELWDYLRSTGWSYITEDELCAVLDYHCRPASEGVQVSRAQVVPRLWLPQETATEGYQTPNWGDDPLFSHLGQTDVDTEEKIETKKDVNHKTLLAGASSWEEVRKIVLDALLLKMARMLSIDLSNLDTGKPLHAYGIDSLMAVELRSWLIKELGAEVSVFDITNNSSLYQLAEIAAKKSNLRKQFAEI